MKQRLFSAAPLAALLCMLLTVSAGAIDVSVNDTYAAGEAVLIVIHTDGEADPADYTVEVVKPNGETVTTTPRREGWNSADECFETYTIDMLGDYTVHVTGADGSSGEAAFTSVLFSTGSILFTAVSVAILAVSIVVYAFGRKRRTAGREQ